MDKLRRNFTNYSIRRPLYDQELISFIFAGSFHVSETNTTVGVLC